MQLLLLDGDLRKAVCEGLCAYHKPGRFEEPGCGGLVRLAGGDALPEALRYAKREPEGGDYLFGVAEEDPRLLSICGACDFRPDGCDFRDPAIPRDACSPCGGLRAVAYLISLGG